MGLFSSSKKTENSQNRIRPVVVRTQNVAKEIAELSRKYNVNSSTLDFDILEIQTYTRLNKDKTESDWQEVSESDIRKLDDILTFLNKNFEIKQEYEVEIFTKDDDENPFKNFHAAVGANSTKCKVYLSIKAGSEVVTYPRFEEDFFKLINKMKIRAGILVNVFDDMVKDVVSRISALAKVGGSISYDKNQTILIAEAYEPTPTTNDDFIIHYDKHNVSNISDKIDYSKRGFIHSVLEGNILMEYIKPKKGKAGRNCRGEFLEPAEPIVKNLPNFNVDDTIEVLDNQDTIQYRAKISGYIAQEANMYMIKTDMDISEISFRATGSVFTGLDTDVAISVKENDYLKDAIGTGMEVEVSEINIKGNVGAGAKVHAKRASIEGQTHKDSKIYADDLTINIHKGLAVGENIKITRLESGTVDGKKIEISQAVGGNIRGKEIEIGLCGSHVKATASRLIEIIKMQGSENVFTIDPLIQRDKKEWLEENKNEISQLKESVSEIKREVDKYKKLVKDNTSSFNEVKQRLLYYKKNGIKMPVSFVTKYKQFYKMQEHLENITKEYNIKNDKLTLLVTKISSFQDNIADARIINRDRWVGHNELIFKLVDPPVQISYKPHEGSPDKIFAIVEIEDNVFEIQAVHK